MQRIKILILLPSLSIRSPLKIALDIGKGLSNCFHFEVAYFDDKESDVVDTDIKTFKIGFFSDARFLEGYDIVHSHLMRPNLYVAKNRKYIRHAVTTLHSDIKQDLSSSHGKILSELFGFLWKHSLTKHDQVIFLTDYQYQKYNIPNKNSSVIANGFKFVDDKEDSCLPIKTDDKVVLGCCCNAVKVKGLEQVIRLLSLDKDEKLMFMFLGDGPEIDNLANLAKQLGVFNRILFLGRVKNVKPYLSLFDVYVSSSISEGLPVSLLEAASCKIPIVSSDIDNLKSVFSDDEVIYYRLNDIEDLLTRVEYCIENGKSYAERAYLKYLNDYTLDRMLDKYKKVYEKGCI